MYLFFLKMRVKLAREGQTFEHYIRKFKMDKGLPSESARRGIGGREQTAQDRKNMEETQPKGTCKKWRILVLILRGVFPFNVPFAYLGKRNKKIERRWRDTIIPGGRLPIIWRGILLL